LELANMWLVSQARDWLSRRKRKAHAYVDIAVTVDEFVEKKVLPEFRPVVAAIRSLMQEVAPEEIEAISYGIPMYGRKKPIAWINPSKTGITFGFREGTHFEDRYGLLRGTGKHAKHVRIRNTAEVNKPALEYYIKQALELNQ
jgi:uncharacterized protein YdhG (YjbR/CyaY superfamily)